MRASQVIGRRGRAIPVLPVLLLVMVLIPSRRSAAWPQTASPSNQAQDSSDRAQDNANARLTVGIKSAAPFVISKEDGGWTGISIELWEHVARSLDLDFQYVETDLAGLIEGVASREFDVGVAALTITADREERLNFTHPFYTTGLGIAVPAENGAASWIGVLRALLSSAFFAAVSALAVVLLGVGFVLWLVERRRNADQFGGSAHQGLGNAFWWAAVTMTTVGYGDKAPTTFAGRLIALVWMFASIIIISGFTAAIASALTVGSLGSVINGPNDLRGHTVATIPNSTSTLWLQRKGIAREQYETPMAGLHALRDGQVDAMVYDAPILRYLAINEMQGHVQVLPATFNRQDYGFALPDTSPLREAINVAMLEYLARPEWQDLVEQYVGEK